MKHIIPTDVINKVLAYLSSKTYSEVVHLIEEIKSNAEPHVETEKNSTETQKTSETNKNKNTKN